MDDDQADKIARDGLAETANPSEVRATGHKVTTQPIALDVELSSVQR